MNWVDELGDVWFALAFKHRYDTIMMIIFTMLMSYLPIKPSKSARSRRS